ncbi:MAG: arsinothricin resistance N-acetyltransferase ArsN1 [Brevundimonas sp.]|uniref:arsinothricin resistance N-acetyltransferase ArsN1 family A n=1 Tax=Brevundimonas sp. TaxID=1871086 RepID=UPI00271AAE9E|nr:arsinothricin resistance N-acetyltransferase ArsN1 family A [Brevundimonas sp.]MDO9588418.1 arsinothricin resistance N-acetyltransferase ArsN1 [Brevundimonas sp.]
MAIWTGCARAATPADAAAIALIYNQGIEDRVGTFETERRTPEMIARWFDGRHPVRVVTGEAGPVIAFAASFPYADREVYRGVAEFSVYVSRDHRGRGAGREAMGSLIEAAREAGYWKLLSRVFPENTASLGLLASLGFREVGVLRRHGQLDGVWRDVVLVERLLL